MDISADIQIQTTEPLEFLNLYQLFFVIFFSIILLFYLKTHNAIGQWNTICYLLALPFWLIGLLVSNQIVFAKEIAQMQYQGFKLRCSKLAAEYSMTTLFVCSIVSLALVIVVAIATWRLIKLMSFLHWEFFIVMVFIFGYN